MADLTAIFGILVFLGLSYPCYLAIWILLLPGVTERAHFRLEHTPGRCFGLGLGVGLAALLLILILLNLPFGPAKLLGWAAVAAVLAISSLGGAGWASLTGSRLFGTSGSPARRFVSGAAVTELAALFPVFGWFIIFPYLLIVTLGAALFAITRRMPASSQQADPIPFRVENPSAIPGGQV